MISHNVEISLLIKRIEEVGSKLNLMTEDTLKAMTDKETVSLSQELDDILMEFINKTKKNKGTKKVTYKRIIRS